jgi:16S rRNA processing protein RimM
MTERGKDPPGMVCLGTIMGAHGVKGDLRIRSFTAEPSAIAAYGPLTDASGRLSLSLRVRACRDDEVIAVVEGVNTRDAAEALRGLRLYVTRQALPEPAPDEYYFTDLIGLDVDLVDEEGRLIRRAYGRVANVGDVGGGAFLDIVRPDGGSLLVPFTRAAVPIVDVAGGRLAIADLAGLRSGNEGARPNRAVAALTFEIG